MMRVRKHSSRQFRSKGLARELRGRMTNRLPASSFHIDVIIASHVRDDHMRMRAAFEFKSGSMRSYAQARRYAKELHLAAHDWIAFCRQR